MILFYLSSLNKYIGSQTSITDKVSTTKSIPKKIYTPLIHELSSNQSKNHNVAWNNADKISDDYYYNKSDTTKNKNKKYNGAYSNKNFTSSVKMTTSTTTLTKPEYFTNETTVTKNDGTMRSAKLYNSDIVASFDSFEAIKNSKQSFNHNDLKSGNDQQILLNSTSLSNQINIINHSSSEVGPSQQNFTPKVNKNINYWHSFKFY